MPIFNLGTSSKLPEGVQVLKIASVKYNEDFGKLEVGFRNAKGVSHTETYYLLDKTGEPRTNIINAVRYLCRIAMNDFSLEGEFELNGIIDHYIRTNVRYDEVEKNDGTTATYIRLDSKAHATGFDDTESKPAYDINSLLDDDE